MVTGDQEPDSKSAVLGDFVFSIADVILPELSSHVKLNTSVAVARLLHSRRRLSRLRPISLHHFPNGGPRIMPRCKMRTSRQPPKTCNLHKLCIDFRPLMFCSLATLLCLLPLRFVAAHTPANHLPSQRRTLGHGVHHPQATFDTTLRAANNDAACDDPLEVASRFIRSRLPSSAEFELRADSYTDSNTKFTHAYARQLVHGLEVIDGDMNVNVKDCTVISFGDSFFVDDGSISSPAETLQLDVVDLERYPEQVVLGKTTLSHESLLSVDVVRQSMKTALLQLILISTPRSETSQSIFADYDSHLRDMTITASSMYKSETHRRVFRIDNVPDAVRPVKVYLAYAQAPDGASGTKLALVWKYEVEMQNNFYEAAVIVNAPHRIVSIVDWVADAAPSGHWNGLASYSAFAWGLNDPSEGNRTLNIEKVDIIASPLGWHTLPVDNDPSIVGQSGTKGRFRNSTTTWGNNVFAHENWAGKDDWILNYRPDGGEHRVFDFTYNPAAGNQSEALEEAHGYVNSSVTHLFYVANLVHDLYYRYGFDEASGNFQQYNFERGGLENDGIIADAQDGSGLNNANFLSPPDGQNPRCRMYLWNTAYPWRDGVFDGGVLIHELSHGLVSRLTGGPANAACVGFGEASGMSEGWADFFATVIRSKQNISEYPTGTWITNRPQGARHFLYSRNNTTNPTTYKTLDTPAYKEVHAMGEVWAEMLWVLEQDLVAKFGFNNDLFPPAPLEDGSAPAADFYRPFEYDNSGTKSPVIPKHGNTLAMQLVIDGLKLQPCRPTFFNARDAIIQADHLRTGGENNCTLWGSFASRGLGPNARWDGKKPWGGGIRKNDFSVPVECVTAE
ncbi:hypothetical protein HGRIS_014444 [Hohenbuehelia grisea]|uniref:Extracellular metalloproteinase n=1 Tax=Hohenbuehelia grisea TaxID=104357 RepID=A0ABR3JVL3_9AGAR